MNTQLSTERDVKISSAELTRLTSFFELLIKIDQKNTQKINTETLDEKRN